MSIGMMNTRIDLCRKEVSLDEEGFSTVECKAVASIRAYREGRHGSERWSNRASFKDATDLFRFRAIPHLEVTTDMTILCDGREFEITSVENVKGRRMYLECLAKEVVASGES